jgi:hypothetical protein
MDEHPSYEFLKQHTIGHPHWTSNVEQRGDICSKCADLLRKLPEREILSYFEKRVKEKGSKPVSGMPPGTSTATPWVARRNCVQLTLRKKSDSVRRVLQFLPQNSSRGRVVQSQRERLKRGRCRPEQFGAQQVP